MSILDMRAAGAIDSTTKITHLPIAQPTNNHAPTTPATDTNHPPPPFTTFIGNCEFVRATPGNPVNAPMYNCS